MTESIIQETLNEGKKRLFESPFWSSFIISWLVINWKVVYITFSLESKQLDDKVLYIQQLYSSGSWLTFSHPLILLLIYPFLASLIAVSIIPFVNHLYLGLRKFHQDRDATLEIQEIQKEKEVIKEKMELEKEKMELENSQEEIWNGEYNEIIKTGIIPSIVRFIFEEDGKNHYNNNGEKYLDTYTLATTIKYDLIVETGEREYSLTDKGKYILKKYPSENLRVDLRPF